MDKIEQLSQQIYILNTLYLILDKFELNDEAEYIQKIIKKKEKKHDAMVDDKLYYIKKVFFKFYEDEKYNFLNLYTIDNEWTLCSKQQRNYYKNQFTMLEIEENEMLNCINWNEFKIVPVEEEDKYETI